MRAIDADAFDERVRAAGGMSEEELTEDFKDGVQAVLYMLSNQPTIQPEPHWIPVTERLPEADGYGHYFLVCLENGVVRIDGFSRTFTTRCPDGFYYETDHFTWRQNQNKVVAWMPLPEAYKPTVPPECEGDCGWCKTSVIEKCKEVTT